MLYATVLKLVAQSDGELPANTGHLTHAAFFKMIQQVDPALSRHLHESNMAKPYTVSPLQGHGNNVGSPIRLGAGQEVWMRVSLLDGQLFQVLASYLLDGGPLPELRLNAVSFQVVEALTTPGSHPRAGCATLDDLARPWQEASAVSDTVTLRFLTPTAMRFGKWPDGKKRFKLYPEPVLLWHGLRREWGRRGGDDPGKSYDDWVEKSVGMIAHNIKTRLLKFPKYDQVGFEGWATFRAVSRDREKMTLWRTLADFAFYAGVGYKTPMGMGQVEVEDGDG